MKRDVISVFLVIAFVAGTATASWMCYWFLKTSRDLRNLQAQVNYNEQRRVAVQALAADLNQYALTHPTIYPLLDQIGLRLRLGTNVTSMPRP